MFDLLKVPIMLSIGQIAFQDFEKWCVQIDFKAKTELLPKGKDEKKRRKDYPEPHSQKIEHSQITKYEALNNMVRA